MKAGDKFKNLFSGNEGTIVAVNPDDTVEISYNSGPYAGDEPQLHTIHMGGIEIIPGFSPRFSKKQDHDITNETLSNLAHHPMFPPGTRVIDKDGDVGTVVSRVFESDGPVVEITLDDYPAGGTFDTDLQDLTLLKYPSVEAELSKYESSDTDTPPETSKHITGFAHSMLYIDGVSLVSMLEQANANGWNENQAQIDKEQEQIAARTNQLLNELYHDRARLEKVVADAVELMDKAYEILVDDEESDFTSGLLHQFIDTHGSKE